MPGLGGRQRTRSSRLAAVGKGSRGGRVRFRDLYLYEAMERRPLAGLYWAVLLTLCFIGPSGVLGWWPTCPTLTSGSG